MEKFRGYFLKNNKLMLLYGGLFALLGTILFFRLGSLTPGYSSGELVTQLNSRSYEAILANPINAPFTLIARTLSFITDGNLLWLRVISVSISLGILAIFCAQLHKWHDTQTAVIGTILFGTSSWFLHVARLGTPDVLMFGLFALVACGYWLFRKSSRVALICCFLLASMLLYVPGMIWLIFAAAIWQWRTIDRLFNRHLVAVTFGSIIFVLALAPLIWAMYKDHNLIQPWLGLPHSWILAPLDILHNLANIPVQLFAHGYDDPTLWLRGAPMLELFSAAMLVFGSYMYMRNFGLSRAKLFGIITIAGMVLSSVGGAVTLTTIMPFLYLVVAAGITYVLGQWFTVFPRNPIAKGACYLVVAVTIIMTCAFHLRNYFVAWPQASATTNAFVIKSDTIKK
jgi:hypothetical protein